LSRNSNDRILLHSKNSSSSKIAKLFFKLPTEEENSKTSC